MGSLLLPDYGIIHKTLETRFHFDGEALGGYQHVLEDGGNPSGEPGKFPPFPGWCFCIFRPVRFFRNYPFPLLPIYLNFASSNCLLQRPYIVLFIIFNLLLVPSTKPLLYPYATAFSTALICKRSKTRRSDFLSYVC